MHTNYCDVLNMVQRTVLNNMEDKAQVVEEKAEKNIVEL